MNEAFDSLRQAVDNLWDDFAHEWQDHKWRFVAVYVIVVLAAYVVAALIAFVGDWIRW